MLRHCQSDGLGTHHKPAYCYRPSLHNQSTLADDPLSPALFTEAVQSCATASQMAVRHLAAAALAPLTPPEELAPTLLRLLATATASPAPDLNVVRLWSTLVYALDTPCRPEVSLESLLFCLCRLLQACQHVLMLGLGVKLCRNGMDV